MRKHLALVSALALLAGAGLANAADDTTATILDIDEANRTIVLDDGTSYTLGDNVMTSDLAPGQEVTVSFEESATGEVVVSRITPGDVGIGDGGLSSEEPLGDPPASEDFLGDPPAGEDPLGSTPVE